MQTGWRVYSINRLLIKEIKMSRLIIAVISIAFATTLWAKDDHNIGTKDIINMVLGKSYQGTPWVFEHEDEFSNVKLLRVEERDQYRELFVYMSLQGERACHNTLGLISIDMDKDEVISVDMVHHAPAKRCLTYKEFKNP
jgi:ABC-type uncharacterized transport system ATPase subunit